MLTAIDKNKNKITGWDAKKDEDYYCPGCEEKLLLRQGEIKIHHFAHTAETECSYVTNETEQHLWMKKCLFHELSNSGIYKEINLEHPSGDRIADIYLKNGRNQEIAVECQISAVDISEFRKRTAYYSYAGIYVMWVFSGDRELDEKLINLVNNRGSRLKYSTDEIKRKCHRWFYGRIYYFYNDKLYGIHFHPIENWIAGSCDECLEQAKCPYPYKNDCPKYREGYMRYSKTARDISVFHIVQPRIRCIDRPDKLKIAMFNEPAWWKV